MAGVALGAPCGFYVDPFGGEQCGKPATVPTTYRRKVDKHLLHTHDCQEHVGHCNDAWEFVKEVEAV